MVLVHFKMVASSLLAVVVPGQALDSLARLLPHHVAPGLPPHHAQAQPDTVLPIASFLAFACGTNC